MFYSLSPWSISPPPLFFFSSFILQSVCCCMCRHTIMRIDCCCHTFPQFVWVALLVPLSVSIEIVAVRQFSDIRWFNSKSQCSLLRELAHTEAGLAWPTMQMKHHSWSCRWWICAEIRADQTRSWKIYTCLENSRSCCQSLRKTWLRHLWSDFFWVWDRVVKKLVLNLKIS